MSLALQNVIPVTCYEPRIIQQERIFPVLKGGEQVLYKQWGTTSVSNTSLTFQCPPPSPHLYVDRCIHLQVPVRLRLTSTASTLVDAKFAATAGKIALRSFPIQKALETVMLTINNQSMSIQIGDVLSALEHFNASRKLKSIEFSKCATYPCAMSQNFYDLNNAVRSPLGLHSSSVDQDVPKNQMFTVVSNPETASNALPAAGLVIDFVSTEPLFLSPLYFGDNRNDDAGFYGVNSMSFTFNFGGNPGMRMLAIDGKGLYASDVTARAAATWTCVMALSDFTNAAYSTTAFSYTQTTPQLLFQYITPQLVDRGVATAKVLNYPYYNIERYQTQGAAATAIANGALVDVSINSTNVQLNSIPTKLYIFARAQNSEMQLNPFSPDSFLRLKSVNIQWGNRSGLLASASREQLYDLSVRAGCTMSWADWSGDAIAGGPAGATFGTKANDCNYRGSGSILAIDPVDLGLDSIDAPGKLESITLQINAIFQNISLAAITPVLYVVAVSAGVFTLYNSQASSLIGILNSNDILNSHAQAGTKMLSYNDARQLYGGGFLSDLKHDLSHMRKKKAQVVEAAGVSGAARVSRQTLRERLA